MCGCSFVAFLLGITQYNPIDYNLPFEMFAGKEFDIEPDIDLNFSGEIQKQIHEYIAEKYGKNQVIYGGTVATTFGKTVSKWIKEYEETMECTIEPNKKQEIIDKLSGIKRCGGIHPGGILIFPQDKEIKESTPIERLTNRQSSIIKSHYDYHNLCSVYKFDVLGHDTPTILHRLQQITKVKPEEIDLHDKETLIAFMNEQKGISTRGISDFTTEFTIDILRKTKIKNLNDIICVDALTHGTGTWEFSAQSLVKNKQIPVSQLISNREDIMNYLIEQGIEKKTAYDIATFVRKGKAEKARREIYREGINSEQAKQWTLYSKQMSEHQIPNWYIESCERIQYLFPKSHAISYTIDAFRVAWYKVHYPEAFYQVYFEIKGNIDISKYTNKKQIQRKIQEIEELKKEEQTLVQKDQLTDFKILLEMYERGIKKDVYLKDDYDLINSRAIADYCRETNHQLNTEELAVLIYRNKRMNVREKIEKYKDLIENYPDMEVIERINCSYYSSVKILILQEIDRLTSLLENFEKQENNVVYSYEMYYTSTRKWNKPWDSIENLRTNLAEIDKKIEEDIQEYNDTLAYRVSKKYLNSSKPTIIAEYQVIEQKRILIDIKERDNEFLDLDGIFVNLPTPFKKGDILVSWSNIPYREGLRTEEKDIFVLDNLCTWREGLDEYLKKGNFDSSDMLCYGYSILEDSDQFMCDNVWDYDSFEYYEGNLQGIYRTLKGISSLLKNKISIDIFEQAYERFKQENKTSQIDWYADESLELAGCSKEDVARYRMRISKISELSEEEKRNYLKHESYWFYKINEQEIKQIESNGNDEIFVLMNNGDLYKDGEKIRINIYKIYMLDQEHVYQITKDNKIIPLQEIYEWNDWDVTDKYLNNENLSYEKIVTSPLCIVALTKEGDVRAINNSTNLGMIPENFKEVEDVIIREIDGVTIPYVYKENEYIPLYV